MKEVTLAVLGAGNSPESGPSHSTITNARKAFELLYYGTKDPDINADLMFALGKGPNPEIDYKITEAEAINNFVENLLSRDPQANIPHIEKGENSTNTIENMQELADLIEPYEHNISAIGFIAAKHHQARIRLIAQKVMGKKFEYVPYPSTKGINPIARSRELALSGIYMACTKGISADDESGRLEVRHKIYKQIIRGPKSVALNSPSSSRYS